MTLADSGEHKEAMLVWDIDCTTPRSTWVANSRKRPWECVVLLDRLRIGH